MSGSTIGKLFCVTNFGESHGPAIGCVVDGCPAGMILNAEDIQKELDRRKPVPLAMLPKEERAIRLKFSPGFMKEKPPALPLLC